MDLIIHYAGDENNPRSTSMTSNSKGGARVRIDQSESIATLAKKYGFDHWKTLWEHPENAELRSMRPNPHVLAPGDEVFIPDLQQREEAKETEAKHSFVIKSGKWVMRLELRDDNYQAIEGEPYILNIPGLDPIESETGDNGLIEHELPRDTKSGTLTVLGEEFALQFHTLDPVAKVAGVQARLTNLGFAAGPPDGIVGPLTRAGVIAFQQSQDDLEATGEIDDATRKKLLELHDNDTELVDAEESMAPWGREVPFKAENEDTGAPAPESDLDQDDELLACTDWETGPDSDGICSEVKEEA